MHKNGPDWFPATSHDCDGKMGQIGTEIQRSENDDPLRVRPQ